MRTEIVFSLKDVIEVHDAQVVKHGGSFGVLDEGLLESTAVSPYQEVFGMQLYPTIFDKAAKYMFDFAHYQVFCDGNKRTGLAVACVLLNRNGWELSLDVEEAYELIMKIANDVYRDSADVAEVIRKHVVEFAFDEAGDGKKEAFASEYAAAGEYVQTQYSLEEYVEIASVCERSDRKYREAFRKLAGGVGFDEETE